MKSFYLYIAFQGFPIKFCLVHSSSYVILYMVRLFLTLLIRKCFIKLEIAEWLTANHEIMDSISHLEIFLSQLNQR